MDLFFSRILKFIRRLLGAWSSSPQPHTASDPRRDGHSSSANPASALHGLHGEALALARELDGRTFHLPDLRKVFEGWPMATNPFEKRLEDLVNTLLERIIKNERKLKALKQADFARLIALWYPHATWEELAVATAYSVWIFVWDDEIDVGDTDISNDEELARAYYQGSLDYIHRKLGLGALDSNKSSSKPDMEDEAPHETMVLFADVGAGVKNVTDITQRQRFYRELENFMLQVGIEQTYRLSGVIPSLEKYMEIRSGSVGCAPQIALTDYMLKVRLPESVMESKSMRQLWDETVVICLILNDVYSVQKEITQGSMFNLVPVMAMKHGIKGERLDTVTDEIMIMLKASMANFEKAAGELSSMTMDQQKTSDDTQAFIQWCRYFITGVLEWSLASRRYGMAKCLKDDHSLDIVL